MVPGGISFRSRCHAVECPRLSRKLRILTSSPVSASFNFCYQFDNRSQLWIHPSPPAADGDQGDAQETGPEIADGGKDQPQIAAAACDRDTNASTTPGIDTRSTSVVG